MANIRTCNKHNMIACVEKTEHNADFHQIVDYLTGCSINYSLLVDPDLIGPWLQQFWATASLRSINEVPHIRAMVAGKRVLISEETIRADLLFDDADGVDCFPKQVIWDSLRDIGYEGNLAQLTFSKPLFSPQWKYLVHVLLHCLSPKSTSWEQFGTNIASALVGLATNQKFNFSLMIMNGMLGHIANGKPFLICGRRQLCGLENNLRIREFEKNAQDRESLEGISMITELQVIDSPDGEYLIIHRANNNFRAFDTLWRYWIYEIDRICGELMNLQSAYTRLEGCTMIHMLAERRYTHIKRVDDKDARSGMEVEMRMRQHYFDTIDSFLWTI
ncbi:hypothetical protein Tco_0757101 [Tanacetum coccineum]